MSRVTHALSLPLQWLNVWVQAPRRALPRPTVSVGNLAFGGRAKTPLVAELARLARLDGHRPVILIRGYPVVSGRRPPVVLELAIAERGRGLSEGPIEGDDLRPLEAPWLAALRESSSAPRMGPAHAHSRWAGDEAPWLAAVTGCPVIAHPDRVASAALALCRWPDTTLFLLDDGLQGRVAPTIELAVIDRTRDLGRLVGLRESPGRLQRVDLVVELGRQLHRLPGRLRDLRTGEDRDADSVSESLTLAAGVGDPDSVAVLAGQIGLAVGARLRLRDHHGPSPRRLRATRGPLLITEKDAVGWAMASGRDALVLELRLRGVEAIHAAIATALSRQGPSPLRRSG